MSPARASDRAPLARPTPLAACAAVVCAVTACRIDQFEPIESRLTPRERLSITRDPEAPPPLVLAHVTLSPFAVEHFIELELHVQITAGQSLEDQGIAPRWLTETPGDPPRADFDGPLANALETHAHWNVPPCPDPSACVMTLELTPRGEWSSDVPFPIQYALGATLELERRDRLAVPSDITLSLEPP